MKKCLFCGDEVHDGIVCRNCIRNLPPPDVPKLSTITKVKSESEVETTHEKYIEEEKGTSEESQQAGKKSLLWIVGIVLGFIVFAFVGSMVTNTSKYGYATIVTQPASPTVHPTQTPAPLGIPVILGNHAELSVIDVMYPEKIYLGGAYQFIPDPDFQIVDVGVRIVNYSPGETISFSWNNVYITEENGDSFFPQWGSVKPVGSGELFDPFNIELNSEEIDGDEIIIIDNDAYLRLIFIVRDIPQDILFGIGNSSQINFMVEK